MGRASAGCASPPPLAALCADPRPPPLPLPLPPFPQPGLRQIITSWLDEEWTPLEVHAALGAAAADSYIDIRRNGDDDVSSIVLSLSSRLLAFNYRDTFVNAFDVANKVVEVLMLRAGCDVCCTSDDDRERVQRHRQPADAAASAQ